MGPRVRADLGRLGAGRRCGDHPTVWKRRRVISLGTTPLSQVRVPRGAFHWRVERAGFVPADLVTGTPAASLRFDLRVDSAPDRDMIRIPAER